MSKLPAIPGGRMLIVVEMSIVVGGLSFRYPNHEPLFSGVSFSVQDHEKVSVVGANGAGKSTLLKLVAGILFSEQGSVACSSAPYYIPQHVGPTGKTVAQLLGVDGKLAALDAIVKGSVSQADYDTLADDWEIEGRCREALGQWRLPHVTPSMPADSLSGGERTRLLLAGLLLHHPEIVLLDEPTNHLDRAGRAMLHRYVEESAAAMMVVSHDVALLDRFVATYELSGCGMRLYGGNYSFYRQRKEVEENALEESIHEQEKSIRLARKQANETALRQERRTARQGEKNKMQVPRIMRNTLRDSAENTAASLRGRHAAIISEGTEKLTELKQRRENLKELKVDFDNSQLHAGKLLVDAQGINFSYDGGDPLWPEPIDFKLFSNDRIRLDGDNGSGKTTLAKLLIGRLEPSSGTIERAEFDRICLDQEYSLLDPEATVGEMAQRHNRNNLPEHEVNIRLNRFLFPHDTWDRPCGALSGGEKMRLCLCCLSVAGGAPDLIVLDEPTNNLDIPALEVLARTIGDYRGGLLVVSHDDHFVRQIGVSGSFVVGNAPRR